MTHDELVKRAERWVRSKRYPLVLSDVRMTAISEQPDVIAFRPGGETLLIECKASRADFHADAVKHFRRCPEAGMGLYRWYFAPDGVIGRDDVPAKWGLALVGARGVSIVKRPVGFNPRAIHYENVLLIGALIRATDGWGRQMFGDAAPPLAPNGDPHPRAARVIRELQQENERLRAGRIR